MKRAKSRPYTVIANRRWIKIRRYKGVQLRTGEIGSYSNFRFIESKSL